MAAAGIAVLLVGDKAQRAAAYAQLSAVAAGNGDDPIATAVAIVPVLIDSVLCAEAARVDNAEAQKASLMLSSLMMLEPLAVGAAWVRVRFPATFTAVADGRGTALAAAFAKEPGELTRDDVLLMACDNLSAAVWWSKGATGIAAAAGMDENAVIMSFISACPFFPSNRVGAERNERLMTMALEMCRHPQGLSELERAGVWMVVFGAISQRPALCTAAVHAGMFNIGMAALHESSPDEWTGWRTPAGIHASAIQVTLCQPVLMYVPGVDLIKLFIDSGYVDVVVSVLQAFELRGAGELAEANVIGVCGPLVALRALNLTVPEAGPIVSLLREIPSTLRFVLDHNVDHIACFGQSSSSLCAMLIAVIFGKDEDGSFIFTQEMIDRTIDFLQVWPKQMHGSA